MSAIEPNRVVLDSKEAVNEYISNYEKETQSQFIVWSKDKLFGEKDCAPHPKSLVYWESKEGTLIDFTGKPFIRIGRKIFVCHLGPDKNKMQKENNRLKMLNEMQNDHSLEFQKRKRVCKITKKRNCPARIYCSHVIEFLNDSVQISSNTKSRRRLASAKLRELLENGTAECQNRFHVMTAHHDSHKHDYPLVDTSIPSSINNSMNESSTTIELVVGGERGCDNDDERYSIYPEDVPEEVAEQNKCENTELPVAIQKGTKCQRKAVASSCFEKLRKLQSLLPNLKTNDIAALDTTMDSLLSHMNEMPTKRKQILSSAMESPSTKGRYGLKKKVTPERVGTAVYHDQTVNVSISNSSKRGRFMPQHLAVADIESTQQPRYDMITSPSPQHIILSSQGEQDYSEQQILLHNGRTQTVPVTTVFETS